MSRTKNAFALRGLTGEQIRLHSLQQKAMFINYYRQENATIASASAKAGTNPKQVRRWRVGDAKFGHVCDTLERFLINNEGEDEEAEKAKEELDSYFNEMLGEYNRLRAQGIEKWWT